MDLELMALAREKFTPAPSYGDEMEIESAHSNFDNDTSMIDYYLKPAAIFIDNCNDSEKAQFRVKFRSRST